MLIYCRAKSLKPFTYCPFLCRVGEIRWFFRPSRSKDDEKGRKLCSDYKVVWVRMSRKHVDKMHCKTIGLFLPCGDAV